MKTRQYCTFAVADLLIGIDVERVREILAGPELTPVPLAPPAVLGLLNLRGEIVTVIDVRGPLGVADGSPPGDTHVIIGTDGETVSLVVDAEQEVTELDPATAQAVPETIRPDVRRALSAIYELDNGPLLLVLDIEQGLTTTPT
jgi:purine-binding chemotaxis protein CheW